MVSSFQCFSCHKVVPLLSPAKEGGPACPSCGSRNGEVLSEQRVKEGREAGAIFNIDPTTGKRAKPKR